MIGRQNVTLKKALFVKGFETGKERSNGVEGLVE